MRRPICNLLLISEDFKLTLYVYRSHLNATFSLLKLLIHIRAIELHFDSYCNVDDQIIARQRLSKHVTHATIEVRVFIARCWATRSTPINSLARNHVNCIYAVSASIVVMQ
jgi:hypothetical protein